MPCPTTSRRSPAPCSRTACCSPQAREPRSGPRSCATRWSECPHSERHARPPPRHGCSRPGAVPGGRDVRHGVALRARGGADRDRGRVHRVGAARGPGRSDRAQGRATHGGGGGALPAADRGELGDAAPARGRADRAAARLAGLDRRALVAARADQRALLAPRAPRARARPARHPRSAAALLARARRQGWGGGARAAAHRAGHGARRGRGGGRGAGRPGHRSGRDGTAPRRLARRARDRRAAALPRGRAGVAHPLAHRRAARRDARAAAGRRARRGAADRDGPVGPLRRGGARHGRARRGVAVRAPGTSGRLRRAAGGRAAPDRDRARHGRVARDPRAPRAGRAGAATELGLARTARGSRDLGDRSRPQAGASRARAPAGGRAAARLPHGAARGEAAVRGRRLHRLPGGAGEAERGGMSGPLRPAAATAGAPPSAARPAAATSARETELRVALIRLATFAALALFCAAHWAALVAGSSFGRTLFVVLVAVGGGAVLILLGLADTRRLLTRALGGRSRAVQAVIASLALLTGFATLCLVLGAAGLPLPLLGPENWSEFADGLDRGLGGVQGVNWPYDGKDWWIRQTILLGAPFLLAIAATLAFFPSRRGASLLRASGLVVVLVLYGTSVVEHDPGEPLLRGFVLLVLVAAWLWLPRVATREAATGAAVVIALGILSLPPAAALDGDRPWWDYRAWNWFGGGTPITFSWNHEYGPLDWPREGTTLLNIRSDRPHYWKAETLDGFGGLRCVRTELEQDP